MARLRVVGATTFALLLLGGLLIPISAANPVVPYCGGSVSPIAKTAPTVIMPEVCEQISGRVFPEAIADSEYAGESTAYATDYVSFPEFEAGIQYLDAQYPDYITIHKVAESRGLAPAPAQPLDRFPIYIIEVTNEQSPFPMEERIELLFMLSIHGNEKGGREGGMRVIEDLVAGRGISDDPVQNGAGIPGGLEGPNGPIATYHDYLDVMRAFFLFPNVDGWMHDEIPYVSQPLCGTLFCRGNGNGTDLNRQMPTIGWQLQNPGAGRIAVNEPEAKGYLSWLVDGHKWAYAIDIHGQLNHANFVPVMMPAGSFSPQEMLRSTRLAETLKERLNTDPHFAEYSAACGTAEQPPNSPSTAVCSGTFAEWSTVWDAIGYTDSGFSGDFFAQSTGLNAPGYDIEMSYNHMVADSQYEVGAAWNDFHVEIVRQVVKSFFDAAALDVQVSLETNGKKTLYVESLYVATNLDDETITPGGWADENPGDDHWQYSAEQPLRARPAKFWSDMIPFVVEGDKPGVLAPTSGSAITRSLLDQYTTLVIPGSAINQFVDGTAKSNQVAEGKIDTARLNIILDWVKAGGNLILTDSALEFFDLSGLTSGAVDPFLGYAGAIDLDRAHELNKDVRGAARQTYEPVPLGFQVGINSPIWSVNKQAFEGLGGDIAGTGYSGGGLAGGGSQGTPDDVTLGRLPLEKGMIQFIGALLPDPTEEFYHPYGLDDYATTYSGNQILRNMLGWTQEFSSPPIVIGGDAIEQSQNEPVANPLPAGSQGPNGGDDEESGTPGPGLELVLVAVMAAAFLVFRRRRA